MAEPQSPFDEPDDEQEPSDVSADDELPPRKYSFMILGVMLFVLVWVRELSGMRPEWVMVSSAGVFILWIFIHVTWFMKLPEGPPGPLARSGAELEDTPGMGSASYVSTVDPSRIAAVHAEQQRVRARLAGRGRNMLCLGVLIGIWTAYMVPLGLIGLTVVVLGIFLISSLVARVFES